ncbi:hypothetical protein LWI29_003608 [Acer saccharum]|uniref:Uncharacterized protein n=1 Tax=Acer saccharum TaxID=4024 RepID=A0AA39TIB8_ACESA|nr:hypothetical protein LWI29_003608 [Acer saccharum]
MFMFSALHFWRSSGHPVTLYLLHEFFLGGCNKDESRSTEKSAFDAAIRLIVGTSRIIRWNACMVEEEELEFIKHQEMISFV